MQIKKPVKQSLPKQIIIEIENAIKNGIFKVGEKIPSEPELVKEFEVSRNTIREAIQSLIQAGVLESRQGDGTYVITKDKFEANILTRLNKSEIHEIFEVRSLLEKEIVKLAAQRRSNEDLKEMKIALEKINSINYSYEENSAADLEFHLAIAKASQNSIFYDLYKSISQYICTSVVQKLETTKIDKELILKLHLDLYEAIYLQDENKAQETINKILQI